MKSHLTAILFAFVLATPVVSCGAAGAIEQLFPATRDTEWAVLCRSGSQAFQRRELAVAENLFRRASSPEVLHLVSPIRRVDTALNLSTVLLAQRKLREADNLVESQDDLAKRYGWSDRLVYLRIKRRLLEVYRAQNSKKALAVSAEVVELSRKFFGIKSVQFLSATIERCVQLEANQDWKGLVDSAKKGVSALTTAKGNSKIVHEKSTLNSMLALGLLRLGNTEESKRITRQYLLPELDSAYLRSVNAAPLLERLAALSPEYGDLELAKKIEQTCFLQRDAHPDFYNTAVLGLAIATPLTNLSQREELLNRTLANKLSAANRQLAMQNLANVYFARGEDTRALQTLPPAVRASLGDADWYCIAALQALARLDLGLAGRYADLATALSQRDGENSSSYNERRYRIAKIRMNIVLRNSVSLKDPKLVARSEALFRDAIDARLKCGKPKALAVDDEELAELCNFLVYRLIASKQYSKIDDVVKRLETVVPNVTERSDGRANWNLRAARAFGFQTTGKANEAIALLSGNCPDRKPFEWEKEMVQIAFVGACTTLLDRGNTSSALEMARRGLSLIPNDAQLEKLVQKSESRR